MQLAIYNHTDHKIEVKQYEQISTLFAEEGFVEVAIIERDEMQKLNAQWRGKDKPTDVLSFAYDEPGLRGEILIYPFCYPDTLQEIDKLIIHGVLHILGYEHEQGGEEEKKMEARQQKILHQWRNRS